MRSHKSCPTMIHPIAVARENARLNQMVEIRGHDVFGGLYSRATVTIRTRSDSVLACILSMTFAR